MIIEVKSEQRGLLSSTNTRLGRQMVHIILDGKDVGHLSGDHLNAQLIAQGFEIVDYRPIEQGDL